MSSYRGNADGPARAKAVAAVVAVHAALAAAILFGLDVRMVPHAVERLTTFNIEQPPPPPPPPPAPERPRPHQMKKPQGAPAAKAEASPIVAPEPRLPVQSPVVAAKVAGAGSAASSGAGLSGNGTGAGGSGNGPGGGGVDYSRFTPARLVRNLSRREYQAITRGVLPQGSADVSLVVSPDGSVSSCRLIRSSGNGVVDAGICPALSQRLRFRPALDDRGRAIDFRTNFHASWSLGF